MSSIESFPLTSDISIAFRRGQPTTRAMMLLGLGQHEKSIRAVSGAIPEGLTLVEALPYHQIPLDTLEPVCVSGLAKLIRTVSGGEPVHGIAESQAAPMLVKLAAESPHLFKSLTLLEPLGFNKSALGATDTERYRNLMTRSRQFWKHPNQSFKLRGNRDTMLEIAKRSIPAWHRIKQDYIYGANQDVIDATKRLAEQMSVRIFTSASDSLFPYDEIEPNLTGSSVTLIKTAVDSHLNRATPKGIAELQAAISSLPE